jgi:osmoprotectant transport system substrate-binding protein
MRRVAALLLLLAGCRSPDVVTVGSKNFTEQRIVGELLAQTVEAAGLKADRRFDLGGTFVCDAALRAGQIDAYVEYTGTALTAILKQPPLDDPVAVLERVRAAYGAAQLRWMSPLGFDNTFALVVRDDDAKRLGIATISDAVAVATDWVAGFGYEFMQRPDGYAGLASLYGLHFKDVRTLDLGLLYAALAEKKVDVAVGNSTDGQIPHLGLRILADDRHYFPPYEAAPVVRQATLDAHPVLFDAFQNLHQKLDAQTMQRLNYAVDGEHKDPERVVREFRTAAGL